MTKYLRIKDTALNGGRWAVAVGLLDWRYGLNLHK